MPPDCSITPGRRTYDITALYWIILALFGIGLYLTATWSWNWPQTCSAGSPALSVAGCNRLPSSGSLRSSRLRRVPHKRSRT